MANKKAEAALAKLEAWMGKANLNFNKDRIWQVEKGRFPFMAGIYQEMTKPANRVQSLPPTQKEFTTKVYREYNKMYNHTPEKKAELEKGIKGRAQRTWASLVRQHHFELMLRIEFPLVYSSAQLDARGLDFLVIHKGVAVGLALTLNSKAANRWYEEKEKRNPIPDDLEMVVLHPTEKLGEFWIHSKEDFSKIRQAVAEHRDNIFSSVGAELIGEIEEVLPVKKESADSTETGSGNPLDQIRSMIQDKKT